MIVSEDIPLESTPDSMVTCGVWPSWVANHSDNAAGSALTSRPERCRCETSVSMFGWLLIVSSRPQELKYRPALSARSSNGCGRAPKANVMMAVSPITATLSELGGATSGAFSGGSVKNISTITRT